MRLALALSLAVFASGCATTADNPRDPWEPFNRGAFEFNEQLDRAILKPAAKGYKAITPDFARTGVNNFFGNLNDIGTGLNNILQGKPADGVSDLGRVAVNSVVGIFGFWDVATPLGLEKHEEDFGQTLAVWGVPSGPFWVIPALGFSTLRDAPARYVDPSFAYNRTISEIAVRNSLFVVDLVRTRANLLDAEKVIDEAALDKYTFLRDAWLQRRRSHIHDGRPPREPEEE